MNWGGGHFLKLKTIHQIWIEAPSFQGTAKVSCAQVLLRRSTLESWTLTPNPFRPGGYQQFQTGNHLFPLKAFKKIMTQLHDRSWVFGRLEWYRNIWWMLHESRLFGWRESKLSEWSPVGSHQKWRHVTDKTLAMHSINQLCNTKTQFYQSRGAMTL